MKTQKTTASPTGLHQSRTALAVILLAALLLPVPATQAATLYVSDSNAIGQSTIDRFDSTTGASLGTFVNTNSNISRGLAFDSAGNLYAAYIGTSTIEKFTSTAGVLSSSGSVFASGLSTPRAWPLTARAISMWPTPATTRLGSSRPAASARFLPAAVC